MARKKKDRPAAGASRKGAWTGLLALGGVSIGETKCAIAACASRQDLKLGEADALLVGARLRVALEAEEGQEELFPGCDVLPRLVAVADVHRISVSTEDVSFRLSFRRDDVDLENFSAFAGKAGIAAALTRTGEAGAGDEDERADGAPAATPAGGVVDELAIHRGGKAARA